MNGDINIDIGTLLPYAIDNILSIFGKDSITQSSKNSLQKHLKVSIEDASTIQCVGMDKPISISRIYQKTRLLNSRYSQQIKEIDFFDLIKQEKNAIIFAGPGCGKTTLMHWSFLKLLDMKENKPILFTLRWPNAVNELSSFVKDLNSKLILKGKRVILLVDGYDELEKKQRISVSQTLRDFIALKIGNFYLTCRSFYEIIDLKSDYFYIAPFNDEDTSKFISCFFDIYGDKYDPEILIHELREKGFDDFLSNPLMLTLVCILKTGPLQNLPKNSLGLIKRALDTLTFRWDEKKGIARSGEITLDGEDRIRCLMRIAYELEQLIGHENKVNHAVSEFLINVQKSNIDIQKLLIEMAQWYGIFIPVSECEWTFAHRTIHDYLAARYWVESGLLANEPILKWNTRTAYAICLIPDATKYLERHIKKSKHLSYFIECLMNNAMFDSRVIARSIIDYYKDNPDMYTFKKSFDSIELSVYTDFYNFISQQFLFDLINTSAHAKKTEYELVFLISISELLRRKLKLKNKYRRDLSEFNICIYRNESDVIKFKISDVYENCT